MRSTLRQYAARANSESSALVAVGLKAGLEEGDLTALELIDRNRAKLKQAPGWQSLIQQLTERYRNPNPVSVIVLARLAAPGADRDLRVASASALAATHTKEALPHLASLLDEADPELRALGVGGLAMFANNIATASNHPMPGEWKYRTEDTMRNSVMSADVIARDPSRYLGFWRTWWTAHRAELTGR